MSSRSLSALVRRLASLFTRDRLDAQLQEEINQHIELRRAALIEDGMDPDAAAVEARRRFGNVTRIREETREMWSFPSVETIAQDLRFGARQLRRSPLFTAVAVLSLGVGIGTASAVVALADAVLFRKLPVSNPDGLVILRWVTGRVLPFDSLNGYGTQSDTESSSTSFSLGAFEAVRDGSASVADVVGFADMYRISLGLGGETELANGQAVSGNYFDVLGVPPAAGRFIGPTDDRRGSDTVVMISYGLWQRRFGGTPDIAGRSISINGTPATIVGVAPPGFQGAMQVGSSPSVFVPLNSLARLERTDQHFDPDYWWVLMLARLRPGTSADAARSVLDPIVRQTVAAHRPSIAAGDLPRLVLQPGARGQLEERNGTREPLLILAVVVAIVLLVACANVASLLLVRASERTHEIAVRLSVGASRWRIVRQIQTECLLLGLIAGIIALPVMVSVAHILLPALGDGDSMLLDLGIDARATAATFLVACLATVLFGAIPALRSTAPGTLAGREGNRGIPGKSGRVGTTGVLVATQIALCLTLISGAGLLTATVRNLGRVDPGFDPSGLLLFRIDPPLNGYEGERLTGLYERLLARIRAIPGVESATCSAHTPIAGSASIVELRLPGDPAPGADAGIPRVRRPYLWRQTIEDAYFRTLKMSVLSGRTLDARDSGRSQKVAVVNARFVREVLGGGDAVGRRFVMGGGADALEYEIVGVVGDARFSSIRAHVPVTAYVSYRQQRPGAMTFEVRTTGDPLAAVPALRQALAETAPGVPMFDVRTQDAQIAHSLRRERLFARLAAILGFVTLGLCAVGVYGLLAAYVTRRTPEVGVRMALGAPRGKVRWMVLRHCLALVGTGLAIGVPATLGGLRLVQNLLYGVTPTDPLTIIASVVLLVFVSLMAAYVPARRATRVDPMVALRQV